MRLRGEFLVGSIVHQRVELFGIGEFQLEEPTLAARVNKDAVGEGWFFKLKLADPKELDALMDDAAYQKFTAEPH